MSETNVDVTRAATAPFQPTPQHELLAAMAGEWSGPTRTWFEPDASPEETRTEATIRSILGGRWIRIEYRGTAMGKDHAGEMLVGFHRDPQGFQIAWIDSFHTGTEVMHSTGARSDDGTVSVLGSYAAGVERWGWRTALRLEGRDTLVIEAWNVPPGGPEERAIETRLTRRA